MFEFYLPLPLDAVTPYKRVKGARILRSGVIVHNGEFQEVADYVYIAIAKSIGETQVGINLFYLVDKSTIVGYRNEVGYYLRKGADERSSIK